ncbi:TPA: YxeA family protein [Streptococcus equi subsp. zooepidemicus]|nr:YxeA family protein [Streptococcus equi subsp. zooepidemicus]
MKKNKKWIIIAVIAVAIIGVAIWAKGYYQDRYVATECYYTQIPLDEKNDKTTYIKDDNGKDVAEGKEYDLIGYDEKGKSREVYFSKQGKASDYYTPGTYIKCNHSKTLVTGIEVVNEKDVPKTALEKIKANGTRK